MSTKRVSAVIEQRLKNKVDKYIKTVNLKGKKSVFQNMEMNLSILFYGGSVGAAPLTSLSAIHNHQTWMYPYAQIRQTEALDPS